MPQDLIVEIVEAVLGPLDSMDIGPFTDAAPDPWVLLNFVLRPQPQTSLWCWAAVTAAVVGYYEGVGKICQCEVANKVLEKKNCCKHIAKPPCELNDSRIPGGCNKGESLGKALRCFKHLAKIEQARPALSRIHNEIEPAKRPVGIRESEAHFVVIDGFLRGSGTVHVRDPYDENRVEAQYNHWAITHVYFTN